MSTWKDISRNVAGPELMLLLEAAGLKDASVFQPITGNRPRTLEDVRKGLVWLQQKADAKSNEALQKSLETARQQLEHAKAQQAEEARKRSEADRALRESKEQVQRLLTELGQWNQVQEVFDYFVRRARDLSQE